MFRRKGKLPEAERGRGQEQRSSKEVMLSRLGGWREWLNFVLLFVALEIVVLSLERAHWITPQPSLTLVLILAMLTVQLLTISRLPVVVIHLVALAIGTAITFWQVQAMMPYRQTFYFAVFIASLTWVMGYLSTWFLLRKKNAWVAVVLGTMVILVNLSNLTGGYYWYFGIFFVAAVFLIIQTRMVRGHSVSEQATRHAGRSLLYFMSLLLGVVILAAALAWVTPEVRIPQLQTMIASKINLKNNIEQSSFNIFADVPSKQSLNTSNMRLTLPFETVWYQSDRIDFIVNATVPSYWHVCDYDIYTAQGWENGPVTNFNLNSNTPWTETAPPPNSQTITYTVTPDILTDVLLTTGSFISINKPAQVQVSSGDIIGVISTHVLSAGESYSVTAAVAQAAPKDLGSAGENYPTSVLDSYLQLPPDFPENIRELSENITANTTTPYDKVLKIKAYLSKIPYKTEVKAPPEGTDGVEYFLFTQKAGFCVHFASAMAVMLRSVGVPTRLAIGYLPGDPGSKKGEYILRDKYYHAWTQVYFPGYGWIDIEATPSNSESSGSQVTLSGPVVSSETIAQLPQWDVWFQLFFGLLPTPDTGTAVTVAPASHMPGPWAFAAKLGQTLLIIITIVIIALFLTVIWLFVRSSFYRWVWRVNRSDLASETYKKLCQLGAMIKISPKPQQTPLEYSAVLAEEFPEKAGEIQEITRAYLERQFGGREGKLDLFNEARLLKARRNLFDKLMSRLTQVEKVFRGRL
jgi:transglutaminase-like putative cysteine protease